MSAGGALGDTNPNNIPSAVSSPSIARSTESNGNLNSGGACKSAGSGITAATSTSTRSIDLPKSSYDGSHLHWKAFRRNVLAPHRIYVVEGPPSQPLPDSLIALIEASQGDAGKFEEQKKQFREQVVEGRGFGPSPLFPPNLLPSIDSEPNLARCMVPAFNREALPERLINNTCPFYELSKPRSGLGCGFSYEAFTDQEVARMPKHLISNGTSVRFDTGYIALGASLFCPFLVFERTFGQKEQRLEAANNQCAIAGAWCTRSLQMLYAQAWSPSHKDRADFPVSFSCTIDNEIAILNYHWIDGSQSYCMSPVCKFDLGNDEHFHQFNIWIEAIGSWGVRTLLPIIKRALSCIKKDNVEQASTNSPIGKPELKIDTVLQEEKHVTALKDSFSSIPWRLEDDDFTPVSSSVASWGSPIFNDLFYKNLQYPTASCLQSSATSSANSASKRGALDIKLNTNTTNAAQPKPHRASQGFEIPTSLTPTALSSSSNISSDGDVTPPPSYVSPHAELACQKRLFYAMVEIQDLQAQLQRLKQEMSGINTSYQTELSGLRNTINTLVHKVTTLSTSGAPSQRPRYFSSNTLSMGEDESAKSATKVSLTTKDVYRDLQQARQLSQATIVTTPTDPKPKPYPWDRFRPQRTRSSLQQAMTIKTNTDGATGIDANEYSPDQAIERSDLPAKSSLKPVLTEIPQPTSSIKPALPTAKLLRYPVTPGPISAAFPSPAFSIRSDYTNVLVVPPAPPKTSDVLRWTAALLGVQTIGTFIPSTILRIAFLGCITDFALLAFASPHWPSTTRYFMELLKG